uniref:Secreted protein n=1 Tax=Achlya hypogyna TaxID=1202772 RepID=A0A0A7CPV4_ACHHY|nr:secreted protein [Achlya hypogyna]
MRISPLLVLAALVGADEAVPRAAYVNSIGNVGAVQNIRLEADLAIGAGRELQLPIYVPPITMAVNASGPAKVLSVTSPHANGLFGVGEVIDIQVKFTSAVDVVGAPVLQLRTGCHSAACAVPEIQTFYCQATSGQFALSFNGQTVRNIPYNASPMQLRDYLLRLTSIASVSVSYDAGISLCAFRGTNVRVTFDRVNFPGVDGDLPLMTFDPLNTGGNGSPLAHHTFAVALSPSATELQAGVCPVDRLATFWGMGATPDVAVFRYIVRTGDATTDLEYTSADAIVLGGGDAVYNRGTFTSANIKLPVPGRAPVWATGGTSSLGVNAAIAVSSVVPTVVGVSSTAPNGVYGVGHVIEITVTMSLPVVFTGAPYLVLSTGVNSAVCPLVRVDGGGLVLVARYTVSPGDFSLDLTYVAPSSLVVGVGGSIRRLSTTPTTDANVVLPTNGLAGSLIVNKNLVIDTTPPYVTSVSSVSPAGTYTVGDTVVLSVTYSQPVVVAGTPTVAVATGVTDLFPGFVVQKVPTNGDPRLFTFPSQIDLSWVPVGFVMAIGGQRFTVASVAGFLVTTREAYTGAAVNVNVDLASPQLSVFSPGTQTATYVSGSGTTSLAFQYVVQQGDVASPLTTATTLVLTTGASILRSSTTPTTSAALGLPAAGGVGSLDANVQIVVDSTPPRVVAMTTPNLNGVYGPGLGIVILVAFSKPVAVVGPGTPRILMNSGTDRFATYVSGSGSTTLTFVLTTTLADATPALGALSADAIRMPLRLVSICRLSMAPALRAVLTLPTLGLGQIVVDPLAPTIVAAAVVPSSSLLRPGDNLDVVVSFSEAVDVSGAPILPLNVGASPAVYISGSGTAQLLFHNVVAYGDAVPVVSVASVYAVGLNGGGIQSHASGRAASLVVPPVFRLDRPVAVSSAVVPVTSVAAVNTDGTYTVGAAITVAVEFADPVVVVGTPQLLLATGNAGGDQPAVVASVNANRVYFTYTVQASDATGLVAQASTTALRCWNDNGLNINAAVDAAGVAAITWGSSLAVGWAEGPVLRLKRFNMNPGMPLWTVLDNGVGLNVDPAQAAAGLSCATLGSQLVCTWQEANNGVNLVRAAVLGGGPAWSTLSAAGLNFDATKNAGPPVVAVMNAKIYVAWSEMQASGRWSINVRVWNGNAVAPTWTFVSSTLPLAVGSDHKVPSLRVHLTQLVLIWQQTTGAASVVRVAAFNGADNAPVWTAIDGGFGLNVLTTNAAAAPALVSCSGRLYAAWHEGTVAGTTQIQVKAYSAPAWLSVSPTAGLNSAPTVAATLVQLACLNDQLFASWQEAGSPTTVRSAVFNGNNGGSQWTPSPAPANDNLAANAVAPTISSVNGQLFLVWAETLSGNSVQARAAVWDPLRSRWASVTYSCIRRLGSAYNVPAALSLPDVHSGQSLSDQSHLRIDTTAPSVVDVATTNAPAGLYAIAETVQTVAITATTSSAINGGQFQLVYGGYDSACLAWNAGASDVQAALNGIAAVALAVTVNKVAGALLAGDVFQITFTRPAMGIQSLTVGTNCAPLSCSSGAVGATCASVAINAERSYTPLQAGFIEFSVLFSAPIQVLATPPTLSISTGVATTATAVYTPASNRQSIDVGVTGTSALAGGTFQLQYGAAITGCIDPFVADGQVNSMRRQLLNIPDVATLGIAAVTTTSVQNGWRYTVLFAGGTPLALTPVAPTGACRSFSGAVQTVDVTASAVITAGEFTISHGTLVGPSDCLSYDISASALQAAIVAMYGGAPVVRVTRQDFALSHRYTLMFNTPALAQSAISVATGTCAAFACNGGACASSAVVANADYTVAVAPTKSAVFRYVVQPGDGVQAVSVLALSPGIQRAGSTPALAAVPTLPPVVTLPRLQLYTMAAPTVTSVAGLSANGAYSTGDRLYLTIGFSQAVLVRGAPTVELNSRGRAQYVSGNMTSTLRFQYKVLAGETTGRLDCYSVFSLRAGDGVLYQDPTTFALVPAVLTVPVGPGNPNSLAAQSTITIDASVPTVLSVSSVKPAGTYGAGEAIDFIVQFSIPVAITGAPSILLNSGGSAVLSYGGSRQLIDIGTEASVAISSGQYAVWYGTALTGCINFNDAAMLQAQLLALPAVAAIGIASVVSAPYGMGTRVVVTFATAVPHAAPLALTPVQVPQCLPLVAGVNDQALVRRGLDAYVVFRYVVGPTDGALVLGAAAGAISLNAGTIFRKSNQPSIAAALTLPVVQLAAITVAGAAPSVTQVAMATAGGVYGVAYPPTPSPSTAKPGQIVFTVTFSLPVVVQESATVAMNTGRLATLLAQSSPTTCTFVYTIGPGDVTPSLEFANPQAFTGTVRTLSTTTSQAATTTLPLLGLTGANVITIQADVPPAVTTISSNHSNGVVGAGEVVDIQVTFGKSVCVLSGLNRHPRWPAQGPAMITSGALTYLAWSERASLSQSIVYVATYDGAVYQDVCSLAGVNRNPNGNAANPALWVWNSVVYVAWDEDGIINVAAFNGNVVAPVWTLLPFMGTNAALVATASGAYLVDFLDTLFVAWSETPVAGGPSVIRVASRGVDTPWTFHDTKAKQYGLNVNRLLPATDPTLMKFHTQLYMAWTEGTRIQIAMLALSSMSWVAIPRIGDAILSSETASRPTFTTVATDQGALFKLFYTTITPVSRDPVLRTATIYPQYWKPDITPNVDTAAIGIALTVCQGTTFAAWQQPVLGGGTQVVVASVNASLQLPLATNSLNHNSGQSAFGVSLGCIPTGLGLLWTEDDGVAIKTRFQTSPLGQALQWSEVAADMPSLGLTGGLIAIGTDRSGAYSSTLNFRLVVPPGSPLVPVLNAVSLSLNRAAIQQQDNGAAASIVIFPSATDERNIGFWRQITVDTTPPTVVDVFTNTTAGTYGVGQVIVVFVVFSAPVVVSATTEGPAAIVNFESQVPSADGAHVHSAVYVGGSGTSTLLFAYTTLPQDKFAIFDYPLTTSLQLNASCSGAILRAATMPTTPADLHLPLPGGGHSIRRVAIAVNNAAPVITSLAFVNANGMYYPGDELVINVMFSLPVAVTGTPSLWLVVRPGAIGDAWYIGGTGSTTLQFRYVVGPRDAGLVTLYDDRIATIGVPFTHALRLNGGTIMRQATLPATEAIVVCPAPGTPGSLDVSSQIVLVSTVPTITQVTTSKADGTYDVGETITLLVVFSMAVAVTGTPELVLNVDPAGDRTAKYTGGSGTASLSFTYIVAWGDWAVPLQYKDSWSLVVVPPGELDPTPPFATIRLLSTQPTLPANLTLPSLGLLVAVNAPKNLVQSGHTINIRTDGLRIQRVTTPMGNGTYAVGQVIPLDLKFTGAVAVTGLPTLGLNVPTSAVYSAGTTTPVLRFLYTVRAGDITTGLDAASRYALGLGAGAGITDLNGLPVPLTLPAAGSGSSLRDTAAIAIAGVPPTVVQVAAISPSGTYAAGDTLKFAVTFSVAVVISGVTPVVLLSTGRAATYDSGSGSATVVFRYTVLPGDSGQLDVASTSALTGTLLASSSTPTTPATLTLPAPGSRYSLAGTSAIYVVSAPPTVVSVTFVDVPYGSRVVCAASDAMTIQVTFAHKVLVLTGPVPALTLGTRGAANTVATYLGGSGTATLYFRYVVQPSDATILLDYASPSALAGPIYLASTAPVVLANLALPPLGSGKSLSSSAAVVICNTCPRVLSVAAAPVGTFTAGQLLTISVTFSTSVAVTTGQLSLRLAMPLDRYASYAGGSGTAVLTFQYVVMPGDDVYPVEYYCKYSLFGGTVVSAAAPALEASLQLPPPGAINSLSALSPIRLDTTPPTVLSVSTTTPDGTYGPGQNIRIAVTYSYPVVVTGTPTLTLALATPASRVATYVPGASTATTLLFEYVVQLGDEVFRLDYMRVCSQSLEVQLLEGYDTAATGLACLSTGSALSPNEGCVARSTVGR